METNIPEALQPVKRFLKLASKIQESLPLVSHILKFHAVNKGMELRKNDKNPEVTSFLMNVVDILEKEKVVLADKLKDKDILKDYFTNYVLKIFKSADEDDKDGKATKKTSKDFKHAAVYLEAYTYFDDPIPDDIEQRIVYAKWKSVQISSALEAGEVPQAGPLGFDEYVPSPSSPRKEDIDSTRSAHNSNNSNKSVRQDESPFVPNFPSVIPQFTNTEIQPTNHHHTYSFPPHQSHQQTHQQSMPTHQQNQQVSANILNVQLPPPFISNQTQQIHTPLSQHPVQHPVHQTTVKQGVMQSLWNSISRNNANQHNLPLPDDTNYAPNEDEILAAMAQAKCILSSLQFEDVSSALTYIRRCHNTLSGNKNS